MDSADQEVPEADKAPYENGHMIFYGKKSSTVYLLDHHLWNNNSEVDEESYIQHYSGGGLRSWFMKNRAPHGMRKRYQTKEKSFGFKGAFRRLVVRARRKFWSIYKSYSSPSTISESFDELMPYYRERYPALLKWGENNPTS
jgi:predicted aminopeptidase